MKYYLKGLIGCLIILLSGCSSHPPMTMVSDVELQKFMGPWYVIAHIPTFLEDEAHNAVESYALNDDGTIAINFRFNNESLDGPLKNYDFKGFVEPDNNAHWKVQPIWPIRADYRIVYLDKNYDHTVIARKDRDYVWIMARETEISPEKYQEMIEIVESKGYDSSQLRVVPHGERTDEIKN